MDWLADHLGIFVYIAILIFFTVSSIILRIMSANKKIKDAERNAKEYQELLQEKSKKLQEKSNKIDELECDVSRLSKSKNEAENKTRQLEITIHQNNERFDRLNTQYSELESKYLSLLSSQSVDTAIDDHFNEELHFLRIHRQNSIQTISELRNEISDLKKHKSADVTSNHDSANRKLAENTRKLNASIRENNKLREEISILQQQISNAIENTTAISESSFSTFDWNGDPDCLRLYHALNEHIIPNAGIRVKANFASNHDNTVYITTLTSCTCPDFRYNTHGEPCKHMYALALQLGVFRVPGNVDLEALICKYAEQKSKADQERKDIFRIVNTRSQRSPWLAKQLAQYKYERELAMIDSIPRITKKDVLKEISAEKRAITKERNMLKHQLDYLCLSFPWIEEFITDKPSKEMTAAPIEDPEWEIVSDYLSAEEYSKLSNTEKYQLALDRYEKRHRSRSAWEAGIVYERFVGFFYEQSGYSVQYRGALDGYEDMGRDIIATKGGKTYIVQCKRWKTVKTIHEKHIFQLYGSTILYRIAHPHEDIIPVFVTTTELSDRAIAIARELDVIVYSNVEMVSYPKIKCNIGKSGEKIYHLPFDQQYDHIVISPEKGECYCMTVAEAESLGFRRAKKWLGTGQSPA